MKKVLIPIFILVAAYTYASTLTKSESIVKSPGAQTVKEAIEINETNIDDIISHYNTYAVETDDSDVSSMTWVLDEDDFSSDSPTKLPTQQSVKAYVDGYVTGAATTITKSDLTASSAVMTSGAGKITVSSVTSTELGYLSGVTSAIQTQIDNAGYYEGYACLRYALSSGTNGGSVTAGTRNTRPVNALLHNVGGYVGSPSSNQFTVQAGTYRVNIIGAVGEGCGLHKFILRNVTDSADLVVGLSSYTPGGGGGGKGGLTGRFTLGATKTVRVDFYSQNNPGTFAMGRAVSEGSSEVYLIVEIWKER